jgi:hypothetical protein
MRRHAAYFRLGATEDDPDPNDDLWELHRKYNRVNVNPEPKKPPGPGLRRMAKQAVAGSFHSMANLKLTGVECSHGSGRKSSATVLSL